MISALYESKQVTEIVSIGGYIFGSTVWKIVLDYPITEIKELDMYCPSLQSFYKFKDTALRIGTHDITLDICPMFRFKDGADIDINCLKTYRTKDDITIRDSLMPTDWTLDNIIKNIKNKLFRINPLNKNPNRIRKINALLDNGWQVNK